MARHHAVEFKEEGVHQTVTMIASLESSKCCGAHESERVRVPPTFARVSVLLSRE